VNATAQQEEEPMKAKKRSTKRRPRPRPTVDASGVGMLPTEEITWAPDARLTGGDVDADWRRAEDAGDEAVGGSVATPDQDIVDELGRALGTEQEPDAEVVTSDEILRRRDRLRWHLERDADVREREEEARRML
jgi:hypothetical protein